jgi:subtilisin family serine protease
MDRGAASLLVSFDGTPAEADALAALGRLGRVSPVAPEAGVWSVAATAGPDLRDRVLRMPGVQSAEWSLVRRTDERRVANAGPATPVALTPVGTPTDEYYANGRQWAVLPPATTWGVDLTGTPPRPRIAILDSGIDSTHPEWSGPSSPLVRPYSAWTGRQSAEDWGKTGHGTHVAGSAAAPINGLGVVGTAPGAAGTAEVIPVQISDRDGYSTDETMMKGIRWSVQNGAKVINISAGGVGDSATFQRVVDWAFSNGALIVASVGNDGQSYGAINYPAGYWNVLGVAAQCGAQADPVDCPTPYGLAQFSTRNSSVDIVAPGMDIISSVPPRVKAGEVSPGYAVKDGTSMAAPFVSGVAALVFAANPGATPFQVLRQLKNTATDMGAPGRDVATGSGLINPRAAVTLPLPADDPYEANADINEVLRDRPLVPTASVSAFIAVDDDPTDVYPVRLRKGQVVRLSTRANLVKTTVAVWPPGTRSIRAGSPAAATRRAALSSRLTYTVPRTGRWFVSVRARAGSGQYALTIGR